MLGGRSILAWDIWARKLLLNPLSAMVAIWHHIMVQFKILAQKGFIGTWIFWIKCISERLTGAKSVFSLVDVGGFEEAGDGVRLDCWSEQAQLLVHSPDSTDVVPH